MTRLSNTQRLSIFAKVIVESNDVATRFLRWPAADKRRGSRISMQLFGEQMACGFALGCFGVKQRSRRCRAALVAERKDGDGKREWAAAHFNFVANLHGLGRFWALAVEFDLAAFDGIRGERSRLKKPPRPQPFIDAHGFMRSHFFSQV